MQNIVYVQLKIQLVQTFNPNCLLETDGNLIERNTLDVVGTSKSLDNDLCLLKWEDIRKIEMKGEEI